ncbi:thiamine pyrophosphate-requiring protein [Pigmentiphaga sp. D-2]|uniref:thiamine pyrophosphate-requiring protein n=1 Tax=Pigmentiphaga sp. D-2 TaxID=1002116 RepID=UPI00104D9C21|nr:thiamine pyrophosphate-requiring protein [Pigmentiphaga sp. D-2]
MRIEQNTTAAEALLMALKASGIDYLFANAGNDFAPIIEALANPRLGDAMPEPITCMHETVAMGMAHGHYLASGRMQAVMVHVNVGMANALCGLLNAHSDNVPVFLLAGRTPLTEHGRDGARLTPVQYGQELYDQHAMVRELVKWEYELRYPEQACGLVSRAAALAMAEPRGPVFLGFPREPLLAPLPPGVRFEPFPVARPSAPYPDPAAIDELAQWLARARHPLIVAERGDPAGKVGTSLARLAQAHAIPVIEIMPVRNVMPSSHPMMLGHSAGDQLEAADVILVVDASTPWVERLHRPGPGKRIAHLGPDPLVGRQPVRSFQTDLAICCDTAAGLDALLAALPPPTGDVERRRAHYAQLSEQRRRHAREEALRGGGKPVSGAYISACVSDVLGDDGLCFSELGTVPDYMDLKGPNRYFFTPYSGALGWGMPAALGAQLADRDRLVVACVGDGSYVFANPVACHQIAEAQALPILTIVKNNGMWNAVRRSTLGVHGDGHAARAAVMPLTSLEPSPSYSMVAAASRAHVEVVEDGARLAGALERAIDVIRNERRQALVEVRTSLSATH